jgi:hypothetical protein
MKTIYSILYVTLNSALKERIGIGLLISNGEEHIFKYSSDKLNSIKGLLDSERFNLIKTYLHSLEKDTNLGKEVNGEIENCFLKNDWVSESYISYLSKYSNNLIQFSEVRTIDIDFGMDNFKRLFEKYVYAFVDEVKRVPKEDIFKRVKTQLYPKIDMKVNVDISLDSSHFENLFTPIEIDFIGINGAPVAGQTIDFEKKHYFMENDVNRFIAFTKAIELEKKTKGKYFILGQEPENRNDKNHSLWKQIRDTKFLEFIDLDEIDLVKDYIEKNDVKPFFS